MSNYTNALEKIDTNGDKMVNKKEFDAYYDEEIYALVFTEALRNPKAFQTDVVDKLGEQKDSWFKDNTTNLDETAFITLMKAFDTDNSKLIDKKEIWNGFQADKAFISKPYVKKIQAALKRLDLLTEQSYEFSGPGVKYYTSGKDMRTYGSADSFCQNWGGQVLGISSEYEKLMLQEVIPGKIWHSKETRFDYPVKVQTVNDTNATCTEFDSATGNFTNVLCTVDKSFVCRKVQDLEKPTIVTEVLIQNELKPSPSKWWIWVIIAVVVIVLIVIIISAAKKK